MHTALLPRIDALVVLSSPTPPAAAVSVMHALRGVRGCVLMQVYRVVYAYACVCVCLAAVRPEVRKDESLW